jgi:hypothetical protein
MTTHIYGARVFYAAALALLMSSGESLAQQNDVVTPAIPSPETTVPERQSVLDRARPDYDPLGVRLGSFLVYPSAQAAESYDSNVFATTGNKKDDFYTTLSPSVAVQSDWNVHSLGFRMNSDTKRYANLASENYTNFAVRGDGRLDIQRDVYLNAGAGYQLLHEDRSSPDAVNGKQPVEYHVTSANVGYVHEPGRLGVSVLSTADSYSYNNAASNTGVTIDQKSRDRIVYTLTPRVFYEIVPGYHAFVQASGNERDYVRKFDLQGFQRSSRGWEVDAGTAIDFSHVINGEVFAGYLSQSYDDARLKTATGAAFGANLLWNVTQLTSVRGTVSRTVQETTQFATVNGTTTDASGYIESAIKLTVEHELQRDIFLAGSVGYTDDGYQGINRTDDEFDANVGAHYLINRNLRATADVTYYNRSSNVVGVPYDRIVGMLALRASF